MTDYAIEQINDIWTVLKDGEPLARVISQRDGVRVVEAIRSPAALRQRVLDAVADAVENAFDEVS